LNADRRQRRAGVTRLTLALRRQLPPEIVRTVLGVAVAEKPDHQRQL
jgi:hypothetical protein